MKVKSCILICLSSNQKMLRTIKKLSSLSSFHMRLKKEKIRSELMFTMNFTLFQTHGWEPKLTKNSISLILISQKKIIQTQNFYSLILCLYQYFKMRNLRNFIKTNSSSLIQFRHRCSIPCFIRIVMLWLELQLDQVKLSWLNLQCWEYSMKSKERSFILHLWKHLQRKE